MDAVEIRVKMMMQRPRWQLDVAAWDRKISDQGSKPELARRIAEYDSKQFEKDWKVISNGGR